MLVTLEQKIFFCGSAIFFLRCWATNFSKFSNWSYEFNFACIVIGTSRTLYGQVFVANGPTWWRWGAFEKKFPEPNTRASRRKNERKTLKLRVVIDRGLPVTLVATASSGDHAYAKYGQKTKKSFLPISRVLDKFWIFFFSQRILEFILNLEIIVKLVWEQLFY